MKAPGLKGPSLGMGMASPSLEVAAPSLDMSMEAPSLDASVEAPSLSVEVTASEPLWASVRVEMKLMYMAVMCALWAVGVGL